MVLKEVGQTGVLGWSPNPATPSLLALGGTGMSPELTFVDFSLADPSKHCSYKAAVQTRNRFFSIAWGGVGPKSQAEHPQGVVAGGMDQGFVSLWSPDKIFAATPPPLPRHQDSHSRPPSGQRITPLPEDQGLLHTRQVHKDRVTALEFNPFKSNLLASSSADGRVFILDLSNMARPEIYEPAASSSGADMQQQGQGSQIVSCIAWNRKVQHILASAAENGIVTIWDLKQRKTAISFSDPSRRQKCSALAWNPDIPMQILVAYDDDRSPCLQWWDLRNASYPFKETAGHSKGILDVAWSSHDPHLFLSCGKDCRTVCWHFSGNKAPEVFSENLSQSFCSQVRWAPHMNGVYAAASPLDRVTIHSVTSEYHSPTPISLHYAPRWVPRKGGVAFGFGGKLIRFGGVSAPPSLQAGQQPPAPAAQQISSSFSVYIAPSEPEIVEEADRFEDLLQQAAFTQYCDAKMAQADDEYDRSTWQLVKYLIQRAQDPQRVPPTPPVEVFGGSNTTQLFERAEKILGCTPGRLLDQPEDDAATTTKAPPTLSQSPSLGPEVDAESFFENLTTKSEAVKGGDSGSTASTSMAQGEALPGGGLTGHSASGESLPQNTALQSSHLMHSRPINWSQGPENLIKSAILLGDLPTAAEVCLKCGRLADALLISSGGNPTLWQKVKAEYLRRMNDPFLKTAGHLLSREYEQVVEQSDLADWKEILVILSTYCQHDQATYTSLCERLATRLETERFDVRAAVICYLCASNFPATVTIWSSSCASKASSSLKTSLQDFVEKLTVLKTATQYPGSDPTFSQNVALYADMLANSGRVSAAMRYLMLVTDDSGEGCGEILRDRIYNANPEAMANIPRPRFPFQPVEVRAAVIPPTQPSLTTTGQYPQQSHPHQSQLGVSQHQQQQRPGPAGTTTPSRPVGGAVYGGQQHHSAPSRPMPPAGPPGGPGRYGAPPPPPTPPGGPQGMGGGGGPPPQANGGYHAGTSQSQPSLQSRPQPANRPAFPPTPSYPRPPQQQTPRPPSGPPASPSPGGPPPVGGMGGGGGGSMPPPQPRAPAPTAAVPPGPQAPGLHPPAPPFGGGGQNRGPRGVSPANAYSPSQPETFQSNPPPGNFAPAPFQGGQQPQQAGAGFGAAPAAPGTPQPQYNQPHSPPGITTNPAVGAQPVTSGLPVSWPVPTSTQSIGSTNASVAHLNKNVQEGSSRQRSTPLPPQQVDRLRQLFGSLLESESNQKRKQDAEAKLQELYQKLSDGTMSQTASQKVQDMTAALEIGDYATASKCHVELTQQEWSENKGWLMTVKRLLPKA